VAEYLLVALKYDSEEIGGTYRIAVFEALGKTRDKRAVSHLLDELRKGPPLLSYHQDILLKALAAIGDTSVAGELMRLGEESRIDDDEVLKKTLESLGRAE